MWRCTRSCGRGSAKASARDQLGSSSYNWKNWFPDLSRAARPTHPAPGLLLSPWDGVVVSLGQEHCDDQPFMPQELEQPSIAAPAACATLGTSGSDRGPRIVHMKLFPKKPLKKGNAVKGNGLRCCGCCCFGRGQRGTKSISTKSWLIVQGSPRRPTTVSHRGQEESEKKASIPPKPPFHTATRRGR